MTQIPGQPVRVGSFHLLTLRHVYLAARVRHKYVTVKPNIAELLGDRVRFEDGSVEPVDVIIYCTG